MRYILLLLAGLALVSCAPISKDECRAGDWDAIGYRDGIEGRMPARLSEYAQICGEIGIVPERRSYMAGRERGLALYCTPDSAYRVGRAGDALSPVCTPAQVVEMRPAHDRGMRWHEIEEDIDEIESDIDDLRAEIGRIQRDKPERTDFLKVARLESEIRRLEREKRRLEREQRPFASWP